MVERMVFVASGRITDKDDIKQIEFWGHDAGEFFAEEVIGLMNEAEIQKLAEAVMESDQATNHK